MAKTGHRDGVWKQSNKVHKTGQHRSKGAIRNSVSGKVGKSVGSGKIKKKITKMSRKAQALAFRNKKEEEKVRAYRPLHVILFPLNQESEKIHDILGDVGRISPLVGTGYRLEFDKSEYSITRPNDSSSLLTQAIACDVLILYGRYDIDISDNSLALLRMIGQGPGFPTILFGVTGLDELPPAKRMAARRRLQSNFEAHNIIPSDKFKTYPLDTSDDARALLRQTKNIKKTDRVHKSRSFLLAEELGFTDDGKLKISGYLSAAMSVNLPVHLPGVGDYLIDSVFDSNNELIIKSNPQKQPDLTPEAEIDMLDAEQTFPTEEEIALENGVTKRAVPKGTSSYHAAWIPDDFGDDIESECDESEDDQMLDYEDMPPLEGSDDEDFAVPAPPSGDNSMDTDRTSRVRFDTDTTDNTEETNDTEKYDSNYDYEREAELLRIYQEAKDEREFPDEIDTPVDAKTRFQKFRGLASFRTSPWDVNENLPQDYARIFKFKRWAHAKIRAKKWRPEVAETIAAGQKITIVLKTTEEDKEKLKRISELDSLILFGLLANEHRMSAIHFVMKRSSGFEEELKNKSELIFISGFRRFKCKPIFSQHTNGNKHKMERFLPIDKTRIVMTVFAPIIFPPTGILAFKHDGTNYKLAAQGNLLSCDPDRVVLKRVILSGAPFRINKKTCTIRFMFHNQDDIAWFKPVELRSKYGRRGHITEHLGTHGHFKAKFDQHLTSMDTVIMNLYKRVFPKWNHEIVPVFDGTLQL